MWNFLFCRQSWGLVEGLEDQGVEPAPCEFCRTGGNTVLPLPLSQTHPLHLSSFCTCLCNCTVNQGTREKLLFLISRPFFTQLKTRPIRSWHSAGGSRQLKEKWNIFFALRIQCKPSADAVVSVCGC